ncbi:MAG: hypothetical protein IJE78_13935, partial [Bacteroidaceae bacterium]|nr:hypothetical protein [Bacteroidaceae bacterium]
VSKTAYNNYLHERFTDKEKNRIISALRTRIGYTKEDDGRLSFLAGKFTRKSILIQWWRLIKSFMS